MCNVRTDLIQPGHGLWVAFIGTFSTSGWRDFTLSWNFILACQTLADVVEMIVASQFVMISTIYLDIMVVSWWVRSVEVKFFLRPNFLPNFGCTVQCTVSTCRTVGNVRIWLPVFGFRSCTKQYLWAIMIYNNQQLSVNSYFWQTDFSWNQLRSGAIHPKSKIKMCPPSCLYATIHTSTLRTRRISGQAVHILKLEKR